MSRNLDKWVKQLSGVGAITIDAGKRKANLTAVVGETAYLRRTLPTRPGDVVTVTVLARVNYGTPKIIIDYPASGTPVQTAEVDGGSLAEHSLTWIVPRTATATDQTLINVGVFNPEAGDVDIYDPIVTINGIDIDSASYVEAGSGANGTYQRFGDGTLICKKTVTITDCTTAWGSVFTSGLIGVGQFEKTFVGTPHMAYGTKGSASSASAWVYSAGSGTLASVGVARGTSITGTFSIDVTATGRWF